MTSAERDENVKQNDTNRITDIAGALRLLTRLPLPASDTVPGPAAAWAWPLAGAVVGGLAALVGFLAMPLGAGIAAGLVLGAQVVMTGAMHEDGLADSADGLWGGWDRARRLEIMKDSHIGTYGVMALILITLIRWNALVILLDAGQFWALVVVAALSRAPMAVLMAALPNARRAGLSHSVGQVPRAAAGVAALIASGFALSLGMSGFVAVLGVGVVSFAWAGLAKAKIGGQTGDILGASQQLSEAVALGMIAVALA